jgi:YHS domain-containing protein
MKVRLLASGIGLLAIAVSLLAADINLEGVKCVMISKNNAKAENSADYKGGKVFFCCGNCLAKFKQDPSKAAVSANYQLVATGQAKEVKCPFTGRALNQEQSIKVGNVTVAFCCGNCKGKAAKLEGEEQLKAIFSDDAFAKGFEVQKAK